jgi:parallel beta-helix repeat protein
MKQLTQKLAYSLVGGGLLALLGGVCPASAVVTCAATLTADETMTADLDCSIFGAPITVQGVTLDMAGHRVRNTGAANVATPNGIVLTNDPVTGKPAMLRNGIVEGADANGVRLGGTGGHRVIDVVATANGVAGFDVRSPNSKFTRASALNNTGNGFRSDSNGYATRFVFCTAAGNGERGWSINGDGNTLRRCIASDNTFDGISVVGAGHVITQCSAEGSGDDGFTVQGDGNRLTANAAIGNGGAGFVIVSGTENKLMKNAATSNAVEGFLIEATATGTRVRNNFGTSNLDGFDLQGSLHVVKRNRAVGNAMVGIDAAGASDCTLSGNVALSNLADDMADDAVNCSGNIWTNNIYRTEADPDMCVQ